MSLSPLLPLAGLAASSLVADVVQRIRSGLPFAETFGARETAAVDSPGMEPTGPPFTAINADSDALNEARLLLAVLRRRLSDAFANSGIDTSQPIVLKSDSFGGIAVDSNHPDANEIERELFDRPDLAELFHAVIAAHAPVKRGLETIPAEDDRWMESARLVMCKESLEFIPG